MTSLDLTATREAAARNAPLAFGTRVLCVLFFFSGFPALIYQLIWQRELFLIFGTNIELVTIVVTAFMLGLGLGSLAGGWLSKRPALAPLPRTGGDRTFDRRVRALLACDLRQGRRLHHRAQPAGDRGRRAGAGHRTDAADGRDLAAVGRLSRAPFRPDRRRRWAPVQCQHARRRRGLSRLRHAVVSLPRHEWFAACRRRDERRGGCRRARGLLARAGAAPRRHCRKSRRRR